MFTAVGERGSAGTINTIDQALFLLLSGLNRSVSTRTKHNIYLDTAVNTDEAYI